MSTLWLFPGGAGNNKSAKVVLGGRWKPLILFSLLEGKRRFGELSRLVPGATQRMLTLQLRELEADGIISRSVFAEVPPRVEYALTNLGRTLEPVLVALHEWGECHLEELTGIDDKK